MATDRRLAVVTGDSTGIGFELARCCAEDGFHLLIVADEPTIWQSSRSTGPRSINGDHIN